VSPGAQVLVLDSAGRFLIQRRVDSGLWEIPAGACEPGSSFARTAVAELREETGLNVSKEDLVAFASISEPDVHTLNYPNGDVVHAFALCFCVFKWRGEIACESLEVSEIRFASLGDPPAPLHEPTRRALELFASFVDTGVFQIG